MKQPTGQKRGVWFWVGVVLLSISALSWVSAIFEIVDEPENVSDICEKSQKVLTK